MFGGVVFLLLPDIYDSESVLRKRMGLKVNFYKHAFEAEILPVPWSLCGLIFIPSMQFSLFAWYLKQRLVLILIAPTAERMRLSVVCDL